MTIDIVFIINSALLGVGLAMDAFSVSLANGLNEPKMGLGRMTAIAGTFGIFQAAMPLIGWACIHTIAQRFAAFQKFIPWIALALLGYIGGKMLVEGIRDMQGTAKEEAADSATASGLGFGALMVQGIATSIDALSVGFTIADYNFSAAVIAALVIAVVTFVICMFGLKLGKLFGTKLAGKASILGGVILILIGLEVFIKGVFF